MRDYFDEFDKDGSGSIGLDELKLLCQTLEPLKFQDDAMLEAALLEMDEDGDRSISFDEFVDWWEATMAGKVHFASIAVREYDDIFSTSVITKVVEDGDLPLARVPLARWVSIVGFTVGTALNTVNIFKAFTRNIPKTAMLVARVQNGSFFASRQDCFASGDDLSEDCGELSSFVRSCCCPFKFFKRQISYHLFCWHACR